MSLGKKPIVTIIFIAVFALGCSTIGGWVQRDEGFYQRAMPAHQAPPLPVEVARDIERIYEDGVLINSPDPLGEYGVQAINSQIIGSAKRIYRQQEPYNRNRENTYSDEEYDQLGEDPLEIAETSGPLGKSLRAKSKGPLGFNDRSAAGEKSRTSPEDTTGLASLGGKTISYVVKLGDTLMKIAFEKHGNYLRWREIYRANQSKMKSPEKMHVGTKLDIHNVKKVHIKKEGQPYKIRKNDTLKSISQTLYGTPDRWKDIWKNNPQLIRNPRKIYAGFTLYYSDIAPPEDRIQREPTEATNIPPKVPNKIVTPQLQTPQRVSDAPNLEVTSPTSINKPIPDMNEGIIESLPNKEPASFAE